MLVERLTRLVIQDGISIASILAMTFTEDAAAEMKARLKKALSSQEQTPYMLDQLALLEQADISTIDSFCYKLVQTYYYKIPISYTMSQHVENGPLRQQAFDQAMKRAAGMMDPDDMASFFIFMRSALRTKPFMKRSDRSWPSRFPSRTRSSG
jgi:ATP-dependent helicase/nuclease subunit A